MLDDHSRLACHVQWYLHETAEELVHALSQALLKRGLPRALITDNGAAMLAAETREGLFRLSILHHTTLPYSPYQNGKQEVFFAQVEGRLLPMLENHSELTLSFLNEATQAWVELEYQRALHRETREPPLKRFLQSPSVGRDCPPADELRLAFCTETSRLQRLSDGTISIDGIRFELPSRFRHVRRVRVRYASWNLGHVYLVDEHTAKLLARLYPVDKTKNAEGLRKSLETEPTSERPAPTEHAVAPLLRQLIEQYQQTGLPPAYLPKTTKEDS